MSDPYWALVTLHPLVNHYAPPGEGGDEYHAAMVTLYDFVVRPFRPLRWYTDARDGLCPDAPGSQ